MKRPRTLRTYLSLGRVSNLPTVWTNVLAGVVLSGAVFELPTFVRLAVAASLFYVGGMFLNDAFDRKIDAVERPERPIPSGAVAAAEVFTVGFGFLAAGLGVLFLNRALRGEASWAAIGSGAALGGLVVLYDAWHKQNPLSPVVMGLCRGAVYLTAAFGSGGALTPALAWGAAALCAYVVGLTFVARQENRRSYRAGATLALLALPAGSALVSRFGLVAWAALGLFGAWAFVAVRPLFGAGKVNVGRSVVRLIAGVSLVDALFVAAFGAPELVPIGLGGLVATLALQRWVSGT